MTYFSLHGRNWAKFEPYLAATPSTRHPLCHVGFVQRNQSTTTIQAANSAVPPIFSSITTFLRYMGIIWAEAVHHVTTWSSPSPRCASVTAALK